MTTSIDICVCTCQRDSLTETLRSLVGQKLPAGVTVRIIVADNDHQPSAAPLIERVSRETGHPITQLHAPARNISLARNACLDAVEADFVAFIDDDEVAPPDWIAQMLGKINAGQKTAVFGPSKAVYAEGTPDWIRRKDYHSSYPARRRGRVETGLTGNVLLRYADPTIRKQRFLLEKGRTGGEDTEFFFRLYRLGATFEICDQAAVFEKVPLERANFDWLSQRRFRFGQSYGTHSVTAGKPGFNVAGLACLKCGFSFLAALVFSVSRTERNFWLLRAIFHAGVVTSITGLKEKELY